MAAAVVMVFSFMGCGGSDANTSQGNPIADGKTNATLVVDVVDALSGSPIEGATVSVDWISPPPTATAYFAEQTRDVRPFGFEVTSGFTYNIHVSHKDYKDATTSVTVPQGMNEMPVTVKLTPLVDPEAPVFLGWYLIDEWEWDYTTEPIHENVGSYIQPHGDNEAVIWFTAGAGETPDVYEILGSTCLDKNHDGKLKCTYDNDSRGSHDICNGPGSVDSEKSFFTIYEWCSDTDGGGTTEIGRYYELTHNRDD